MRLYQRLVGLPKRLLTKIETAPSHLEAVAQLPYLLDQYQ